MSDGSARDLQETLTAINTLRGWGAVSVRVGDIAVTFAPAVSLLPLEEPQSEAEKAAAEERFLFGSADR